VSILDKIDTFIKKRKFKVITHSPTTFRTNANNIAVAIIVIMDEIMRLTNSVPLLKKISDLATRPSAEVAPKSKVSKGDTTYPLPRSPRSSSDKSPRLGTSRGRPIAPEHILQGRRRSAKPSDQSTSASICSEIENHSQKIEGGDQRCDSRDDSYYDGSVNTASTSIHMYPPSSPTSQNGDEMDDVIIHRYLAEKNKVRVSEARSAALEAHVNELNRHIDETNLEAVESRLDAQKKIHEHEERAYSFKQSGDELKVQLLQKESQHESKMDSLRAEAEKQMNEIRNDGAKVAESLRKEFAVVKAEYSATRILLEEERLSLMNMTATFKETEKQYYEQSTELGNHIQESNALESKLVDVENEKDTMAKRHSLEIRSLQDALENINDMLSFHDEKKGELSNELKIMSCQYVQSMEILDSEKAKSSRLSKELDDIESKLKKETKKNVTVANQLEEMARGFVDTDELLEVERRLVKNQSSMLADLRDELVDEKSKSEELSIGLKDVTGTLRERSDEVLKLSGLTSSLNCDLESVKKTLGKSLHKVKSLTKKLQDSEQKCINTEELLGKELKSVAKLTAELENSDKACSTLTADLAKVTLEVEERNTKLSELYKQIEEKQESLSEINELLENERTVNASVTKKNIGRITVLSDELSALKTENNVQRNVLEPLESEHSDLQAEHKRLDRDFKEKIEESSKVVSFLSEERDDLKEKLLFQEESVASLTAELSSLEHKQTMLFDNLVDTESKLQKAKSFIEDSNVKLERKDTDFKAIEIMLKEEVSDKDLRLKEEEEKTRSNSKKLFETDKKCNSMYSNLVSIEEKLLGTEEASRILKNKLSEKEKECKTLSLSLDREKNGPVQRKLKVAKKMIQAEKNRHCAILKEVEAKNLIINRIEKQAEAYSNDLENTKIELQLEKEKKATHSGRALQDLHRQLEEERKTVRKEKEELRSMLRSEKATVKSLTMRVTGLEGSNTDGAELSQVLKRQHEGSEQVRMLTSQNEKLMDDVQKYRKAETETDGRLAFMESKIGELIDSMNTMTQYCGTLQEEKKIMLSQFEALRNPGGSGDYIDVLDNSDSDRDDEDTLDGRSLSDFSVAMIPAPRQTQREYLLNRTKIKERVREEEDEDIELTVNANILYED
jgi:chromosome segregation ATPase